MARQKETILKEKVLRDLRSIPDTFWEKINQVSIRGTPDILGSLVGHFVAIELKTDTGSLDPLQAHKLDEIKKTSAIAIVVRPHSWPDQFESLKTLAKAFSEENIKK